MAFNVDFVRFHPCLALIIADTPEANDICGIYNSYLAKSPCRACLVRYNAPEVASRGRDPRDCLQLAQGGARELLDSLGADMDGNGCDLHNYC